ncbi:cyanocobalamin reductase / alkylcobalamin dealkylase-like [Osmerus mordax]|uniref:cyanocobalamin reductase / alkylcobalamin dealkylase-like n=1 Tax=Osmerus mordax TaxID=8014 RepID=UPI00350F3D00
MATPRVNVEDFRRPLHDSLSKLGFEVHPFKIGWYNAVLPSALRVPHSDDTLAVLVISTPSMFELAFLPFLESNGCQGLSDPIDQCVKHNVTTAVSQCFPEEQVEVSFDYEMLPSRKPRFLAQTAAHVCGAAYYYQQADVPDQPWGDKKVYGVCVHPRLGGWFAVRALLLFPGVQVELLQTPPPDCVPSRDARIQLLDDFNLRWQDWSYRNIVAPIQTYSQKQREYFSLPPPPACCASAGLGLHTWGGKPPGPP